MKGIKIFFACALGAFIGALIALQISPPFWWIGLIAGFAVGYITHEFREVMGAVKSVYKRTYGRLPSFEQIKNFFRILLVTQIFAITILAGHCLLFLILRITLSNDLPSSRAAFQLIVWVTQFISIFFAVITTSIVRRGQKNVLDMLWEFSWLINPVAVYIYWLPRGIVWVIKRIPLFLSKAWLFIKEVFRLIHSDTRLMCGVDGAIGAGVGYLAGNAVIGAIAGGAMGAVNYYLIRIKFLKLEPSK